jgi:hypothetical protein
MIGENRAVVNSPYPKRWKLPGDNRQRTQARVLSGARAVIVHSLTYHGIPPRIDKLIDDLPSERRLKALPQPRRDYLSFTVYSLKQMVAAGTVSAETAWGLFNWSWNRIGEVSDENFKGMREAFFRETLRHSNPVISEKPDLLRFEFYARAGEAGLAQYERYGEWATKLVFSSTTPEHLKDEYRKALWLEMRIIEDRMGVSSLNEDVRQFVFDIRGEHNSDRNEVRGSISLFNESACHPLGRAIDATIKSEIGHWLLDRFDILKLASNWASELKDRMNMAGYNKSVNQVFNLREDEQSPMQKTFMQGGFFLSSSGSPFQKCEKNGFPTYPDVWPGKDYALDESHVVAEYVEVKIRQRITRAVNEGNIKADLTYDTYKKVAMYVALLDLEGKTKDEILIKIEELNIEEINEYYQNYREKYLLAVKAALKQKSIEIRGKAAKSIILTEGLSRGNEYSEYYAYQLLGEMNWDEALKLGRYALPALEATLEDESNYFRGSAARNIIQIKGLEEGEEYLRYYAYVLIVEKEWDKIISLGNSAIPALEAATRGNNDEYRQFALRTLRALGADIS